MEEFWTYSVENIRRQVEDCEPELGCHTVRLYITPDGRPSREPTDETEQFYYYPSGGTIRDADRNIIFYEPKLDKYHPSNRGG